MLVNSNCRRNKCPMGLLHLLLTLLLALIVFARGEVEGAEGAVGDPVQAGGTGRELQSDGEAGSEGDNHDALHTDWEYKFIVTEELPFGCGGECREDVLECQITAGEVLVVDCPERAFIYNTAEFVATGNRGITNYGREDGRIYGVHQLVDPANAGWLTYVDPDQGEVVGLQPLDSGSTSSGSTVGSIRMLQFDIAGVRDALVYRESALRYYEVLVVR